MQQRFLECACSVGLRKGKRPSSPRSAFGVLLLLQLAYCLQPTAYSLLLADTHYVDLACATPVSPYTNWTTAARVIQEAVDVAATGDTVLVADGVYTNGGRAVYGTFSNRVAITRAISVQSSDGPEVTHIVGRGPVGLDGVRCAYVTNGAVLSGFTLTNGATRLSGDESKERSGGGAWCEIRGVVSNCVVAGNAANNWGGGAYQGVWQNCLFFSNSANSGGGVMGGTLFQCTLRRNTAANPGGGVSSCSMTRCLLEGNQALYGGGSYGGFATNCTLVGNTANEGGGSDYGTLVSCILMRNCATSGGGSYYGTLNNCNVVGNYASYSGGGSYASTVNNSILYYNGAPSGPNWAGGTLQYCCTMPDSGGTGNITSDPRLSSCSHVAEDSPVVGKGGSAYAPLSDFDGELWRTPPAIGTDEPYAAAATGSLSVAISPSCSAFTVGFEVAFWAQIDGRVTRSAWDFGDGSSLTNRPLASHSWTSAGVYSVVLTAWNADYPDGVSCTALVSVAEEPVYYVNGSNTSPAAPYASWETAATNIQDAIDLPGMPGRRLVLVTNGVYAAGGAVVYGAMINRIALTNMVTVRSVNGPGVTVLLGKGPRGDGAVRCAYVGTNCLLSGFTLTNGATRSTGDGIKECSGGGVWCEAGGWVSNCVVVGNTAYYGGGGYSGSFVGCVLLGNQATAYGGGVYNSVLKDCWLGGNSVSSVNGAGGGAYNGVLVRCSLVNNTATNEWGCGGGAYGAFLDTCSVAGNRAGGYGGGCYNGTLISCVLSNNSAFYGGGGMSGGSLSNGLLFGNSSFYDGGGMKSGTLRNCAVAGNSTRSYGGGASYSTLKNCTLSGNSALSSGGGGAWCTLNNCIVYHNSAPTGPNWDGGTLSYCCTVPLAGGTGNITNDPILVSMSHIAANSPCVAKGLSTYASGLDIDGESWLSPPAMGADEPYGASATGGVSVAIVAPYTTITVGFEATFSALIDGRVTRSAWDFGDGSKLTNRPYASHVWQVSGVYPVVLTAWNAEYTAGVSCTTVISVVSEQIYYVNISNATPAHPYTSWETAATTIQDAVSAQGPPGRRLVLVTNGLYEVGRSAVYGAMSNRVVLTNGVTLRSVGGPSVTVIKGSGPVGDGAVRCAYVGTNCVLAGFTLASGASRATGDTDKEQCGGGVWCETGGVVSNCLLSGNAACYGGGGAYNGKLFCCVFFENTAGVGGGAYLGVLNNCALSGNTAASYGGGACAGSLNNCVCYYNTAPSSPNYSGGSLSYCCTTPLPGGTGNLAAEPKLASASHLAADSPCVGKGSSTFASGTDIDGEPWRSPPSMGPDEPYAASASGDLSVAMVAATTTFTTGYEAPFTGRIDGRVTRSEWSFGDGITLTNRPCVAHAWQQAGSYAVVLTAWNEDHQAGVACTTMVSVIDAQVFYVKAGNASPSFPFASWLTAATNIQDAISAPGVPGRRVVLVTNGVYEVGGGAVYGAMTNRVVLTNRVTVCSVNGPDFTVIRGWGAAGGSAVRCAYVGTNCVLAGFTLTNGATRASGDDSKEKSGGGVWCEAGGIVSNCIVSGNSASSYGGGAYNGLLLNCLLVGNIATNGGAAAYGTLSQCLVSNNASYRGGGICNGRMDRCTLNNNRAVYGGGAYESVISNSTLSGNLASSGGGVYRGALVRSMVSGNFTYGAGGGAFDAGLSNCCISGNSSLSDGGGVGSCTLVNCSLTGNSAVSSGGGAANSTLNNCTVVDNTASTGGGVYSGTLRNSIVYYNRAGAGPNYSGGSFSSCCALPMPPGTGNIADEPKLVSATHLAAGSPCVGRGSSAYASGVDVDGELWRNPPSIGVDEPYVNSSTGGLSVAIDAVYSKVKVGFDALFKARIEGCLTCSSWDFGDGFVVTNQPYVKHGWSAPGSYEVILTAWNGDYPSGVSATTTVAVVQNPVYYVDGANATPCFPYTNWSTAATTIQEAISAEAVGGRLVWVKDGLYEAGGRVVYGALKNRVALEDAVTVCSVNGPAVTRIQGAGPVGASAVRCAYVGVDGILAGFTLTNGATFASGGNYTEINGGGVWCEAGGVVSNCWIVGNSAFQSGGGSFRGALSECRLSGNSAFGASTSSGGGACDAQLTKCLLTGNASDYGGGSYGGVLVNCELVRNSAIHTGGGAGAGALTNCTLYGNYAGESGGGASYGKLVNCTLSGNSAFLSGGGVYSAALNNCIVYYNQAPSSPNFQSGTLNYCCTAPAPGGSGNITDLPGLVSQTHISADSPCVGKGDATCAAGLDIDGEDWRLPPSIGADEPYSSSATGTLTVAIEKDSASVSLGYPIQFKAWIAGRVTRSEWDFGDGVMLTNLPFASHVWASTGLYSVVLTAWNADYPLGVSCTTRVSVADVVYYVRASNSTPVYPYTSWKTAATNIQDAISAGSAVGRLVLVSNGVYATGGVAIHGSHTNRIALTNSVIVQSVNGPEVTVIKGVRPAGYLGVRCAYLGNGCVLAGFTLTNGASGYSALNDEFYTVQSGGGVWGDPNSMVSNCWLFGNEASGAGGGAVYTKLINCRVSGNTAFFGGGVSKGTHEGCLISGNTATYGGGTSEGTINNCLVFNNLAYESGGGSWRSKLNNCTVSANATRNVGSSGGGTDQCVLKNAIVYYNSASNNPNYVNSSMSYSCTDPLTVGLGNITNPPAFSDFARGNFRLKPSSPCINSGVNEAWLFNARDVDGKGRVLNGRVDMGAYEFAYAVNFRGLLQGPYVTNAHRMNLAANLALPLLSPYAGDGSSALTVSSNSVDWIIVGLHATNGAPVVAMSLYLDAFGRVWSPSGETNVPVEVSSGYYYLALQHRNHLAAVSAQPVAFTNTLVTYDFTTGPDKYLGGTNACVELEPDVWGLIAGDADGDGRITPVDREIVRRQRGMTGYLQGDLNLDGKVDGDD